MALPQFDPIDHPRGDDGKFVDTPRAGVDVDQRAALLTAPIDAADEPDEFEQAEVDRLEALDAGMNMHGYDAGLAQGITHTEFTDAHAAGLNTYDYLTARDGAGTHTEVLEAHAHGVSPATYRNCRPVGSRFSNIISHAELLEAADAGVDLYQYRELRLEGIATQSEILEYTNASRETGADTYGYAQMRRAGVDQAEAMMIAGHDEITAMQWADARCSTDNVDQARELFANGVDIDGYCFSRNEYGHTHEEAIAYANSGDSLG
jgi:hypothetical protein